MNEIGINDYELIEYMARKYPNACNYIARNKDNTLHYFKEKPQREPDGNWIIKGLNQKESNKQSGLIHPGLLSFIEYESEPLDVHNILLRWDHHTHTLREDKWLKIGG